MKQMIFSLIILVLGSSAHAFDHTHAAWDKILKKHVKVFKHHSQFDYKAAKASDNAAIKEYANSLSAVKKKDFDTWSKERKLSFLINAYNVFTIQLILDNYPVKSIKKTTLFSPFSKDFFKLFGEERSLGELEHEMIRKWFKEARIHFAIVCASIGCPALQNTAFNESNLEELLEKGSKDFMSDRSRNYYDAKESVLKLSKIFDWFRWTCDSLSSEAVERSSSERLSIFSYASPSSFSFSSYVCRLKCKMSS